MHKKVCEVRVDGTAEITALFQTLHCFGLFSKNVTEYKDCKMLVGVHVCFGTRTHNRQSSHRICGLVCCWNSSVLEKQDAPSWMSKSKIYVLFVGVSWPPNLKSLQKLYVDILYCIWSTVHWYYVCDLQFFSCAKSLLSTLVSLFQNS